MEQLTAAIASANEEIAADLATLEARVSTLRGEWAGEASDAYRVAQQKWTAAVDEMNSLLGRIERTAAVITDRHRAADRVVEKLWG